MPRTRTDAEGRFSLAGRLVPRPASASYPTQGNVILDPEAVFGAQGFSWDAHIVTGYEGGAHDVGDLRLEAAATTLRGRVVDEDGVPIPDVLVDVEGWWPPRPGVEGLPDEQHGQLGHAFVMQFARSDEAGLFVLDRMIAGGGMVSFLADGWLPHGMRATSHEDTQLGDIILRAGSELRVRVFDDTGRPVAGAAVAAHRSPSGETPLHRVLTADHLALVESAPWRTDRDGRVRITGLGEGAQQAVVLAAGFDVGMFPNLEPGEMEHPVVLQPAAPLHLRVREQGSGLPVAGATARARALGEFVRSERDREFEVRRCSGEADGSCLAVMLPGPMHVRLDVRAPGHAERELDLTPLPDAASRDVIVELPPAALVTGRFVDEAGQPLPDVELRLYPRRDPFRPDHVREAAADEQGRFRLTEVAEGDSWSFTVRSPTHLLLKPVRFEVRPDLDLGDIVLVRGGRIAGTVTTHDGRPAAGVHLALGGVDPALRWRDQVRLRTDVGGRFESPLLEPGVRGVHGLPGVELEVEVIAGQTASLDLRMAGPPRVRVKLIGARGQPLRGAEVAFSIEEVMPQRARRRSSGSGGNAKGLEVLPGVYECLPGMPCRGALRVWVPGGPERRIDDIVIGWDQAEEFVLRFGAGAIAGQVLEQGTDRPVVGARVSIAPGGGAALTTDASGRFRVEHLEAGRYRLVVLSAEHLPTTSEVVDVTLDRVITDVMVHVAPGAVVDVTITGIEDVAGAESFWCALVDEGNRIVQQRKPRDGHLRFLGIPNGRFRVRVGRPGQDLWNPEDGADITEVEVEAVAGQERRVLVELLAR